MDAVRWWCAVFCVQCFVFCVQCAGGAQYFVGSVVVGVEGSEETLERISAVSCNVSVSSWVEAWARFLSEIAFFSVAAVLSRVLENFSAVWLREFWKVLAVSEIVLEKNMRDSRLASDFESSKGMEMSRKESLLLT